MSWFGKLKNQGKWYRVNKLCVERTKLRDEIEKNTDFKAAVASMKAIVEQIAQEAGVTAPVWPVHAMPCPLAWWQGRLAYDTFTKKVVDSGKERYVADHGAAFAVDAQKMREAVGLVVRVHSMVNDLDQSPATDDVNPGGVAGEWIDKP